MIRALPKVFAATFLVAVMPFLLVYGLGAGALVSSTLLDAAVGAGLSVALYHSGAAVWQRRAGAGDLLFSDLMLWGWTRRAIQQRRIADAAALLGVGSGGVGSGGDGSGGVGSGSPRDARHTDSQRDAMQLDLARRVQLLERLSSDLEARDAYTHGHSRRVARYSALIAKRMGLPKAERDRIRLGAAVHDVGKVRTPPEVLVKPGALTDDEFAQIKLHPVDGAEMVAILEDHELTEIVLRHHERLDGSGYPDRLSGDAVPLGARIIAVADTFDAITSARPYRAARPHRQAIAILRAEAGAKLDADAVDAFLSSYLGRRPLGAWIAVSELAEQMFGWLAGDAVGTSTRLAAIAAGTVAVGGGAVALHGAMAAPARSGSSHAHPTLSRDRLAASRSSALSGGPGFGSGTRAAGRGAGGSWPRGSASIGLSGRGAGSISVSLHPVGGHGGSGAGHGGSGAPAGAGAGPSPGAATLVVTGSPAVAPGGGGTHGVTSSTSVAGSAAGTSAAVGGTTVSLGVGHAATGTPSVGASVGTGSTGTSVGATVSTGSSSSPSAGAGISTGSNGSPSVNAGVSAGALGSASVSLGGGKGPGVHVGVSLGGL